MRSLSGIQPSGILTLGNYFGAMKQFIDLQTEYEGFYFIADYHALTSQPKNIDLKNNTINVVLDYLAIGLDPSKSTIFLQSDIPEHAELFWILSNLMPLGLLERAHSYKDKVNKGIKPNTGLLTYPILMASDILLYDTDIVPVGKDQKQHLEMTRDLAVKFNQQYDKEIFKLPEAKILDSVAVVPGTDGQKMSKSYDNVINMFLPKNELKKQVMGIVTDSTPLEEPKDPDNNVMNLYKLFSNKDEIETMRQNFLNGNYGYGHAKTELFNKILEYFKEYREKREELSQNIDYVYDVLNEGKKKAREIAKNKINIVKETCGIVGRS